jgi:hypothetical protein
MSLRPERFEELLTDRLGHQYRLRWSGQHQRWMVEQKVARAIDSPSGDDGAVRLRDGYALVLQFNPRPFLVCDLCCRAIPVPVMQIGEVTCDYCAEVNDERKMWFDGFFPLSERTITYLERGSPKRAKERAREIDEANAARRTSDYRQRMNVLEAIAADYWNRVSGAIQIGYTKVGTPHAYGRD